MASRVKTATATSSSSAFSPPSRPGSTRPISPTKRPPSPLKPSSASVNTPAPSPHASHLLSTSMEFRPKAKVNASAVAVVRKNSTASSLNLAAGRGGGATPRSASPFKASSTVGSSVSSMPGKVRAKVTARPTSSKGPPSSGASHTALSALGTTPSDLSTTSKSGRVRPGSVPSLYPTSPTLSAASAPPSPGHAHSSSISTAPIRVKAKVSHVSIQGGISSPPLAPHSLAARSRTASIASLSALSTLSGSGNGGAVNANTANTASTSTSTTNPKGDGSPTGIFPITTATSAANAHRFASARTAQASSAHHYYQPFAASSSFMPLEKASSSSSADVGYSARHAQRSSLDSSAVPHPLHSPPTSAVSFSSRSSTSRSSVSRSRKRTSVINGEAYLAQSFSGERSGGGSDTTTSGLDTGRDLGTDVGPSDDSGGSDLSHRRVDDKAYAERKVRAEAKTNRKIEDLEITNRSLLVINSSLEATKNRQAKELRELKRKLRETRLTLPPREYKAIRDEMNAEEQDVDEDEDEENDEDEDDNEDEDGNLHRSNSKEEQAYLRVRALLDNLLRDARAALEAQPSDLVDSGRNVTKVLSPEEARTWRRQEGHDVGDESLVLDVDEDFSRSLTHTPEPPSFRTDDSIDSFASEQEVEQLTQTVLVSQSSPTESSHGTRFTSPPPITLTAPL